MSPKITPTVTTLVMILVVLIANNSLSIIEAVDTTVESDYCGEDKYSEDDPYGVGLTALLQRLVDTTGNAYQYTNDISVTIEETGDTIYGHAKCTETLEPEECTECVQVAQTHLLSACALSVFAFVELADCDMKYDDSPIQVEGN